MEEKSLKFVGQDIPPQVCVYLSEEFKAMNKGDLKNNWVWYSINDIKKIYDDLDRNGGSGVRIYYGVYDQNVCDYLTNRPGSKVDYSNHIGYNTAFFVPTTGILGDDTQTDCIEPAVVIDMQKKYKNNESIPQNPLFNEFDTGTICPPPTPPKTDCSKSGSNL